eukprot:4039006-Pyramimonas_sp.AAC.1
MCPDIPRSACASKKFTPAQRGWIRACASSLSGQQIARPAAAMARTRCALAADWSPTPPST